MSVDISTIGAHKVKSVQNGESVELKSFWQNQDAAVIFFRRWGCMFCRLWAKELSEIAPILRKNNVKLVGIGVEEAGAKDFVEGNYFDGDLYYVEDLNTYQNLGFKRFNVFSIITSLFWKQSRDAIFKGRSMGVKGDLKGDWVQTGGALLVGSGGTLKTHFVQTGPAEHISNLDILKSSNEHVKIEQSREEGSAPELPYARSEALPFCRVSRTCSLDDCFRPGIGVQTRNNVQ